MADVQIQASSAVEAFKQAFMDNLYHMRGQDEFSATIHDYAMTLAYTVRKRLMDRWRETVRAYHQANPKHVYYLSAEFLLGRQLTNNLLYSDTTDLAQTALKELGIDFDAVIASEHEPGLGNGGLGRLAACFLDSLATLSIPSTGCGIRYEFGIFEQTIQNGWQVERPDKWLYWGNPWEFPQPDDMVTVMFEGHTDHYVDEQGKYRVRWRPAHTVLGIPYHTMVPGYGTTTVNTLRLWSVRASEEFDFQVFNAGDYSRAVHEKTQSENITKVLYPNDNSPQGKQLRLEQQYFFVSCSLQDVLRSFLANNDNWDLLPQKVVIQLNDTHPTIGIAELMRLLVDEHDLEWDQAWNITRQTFAYTCHTLLPEALERWPVGLFAFLLPRHLEIIYEINQRFLEEVRSRFPNDDARVWRMSIIEEGSEKYVRMAHLASVGSFSINGVAELQSLLLKDQVLHDFFELWPEKFNNKTNGVTPRRFMKLANPHLADLITAKIGDGWLLDLPHLSRLESCAEDALFRQEWAQVKFENKQNLAAYIRAHNQILVDPHSMFDIMVKRLHEYKRQLLKVLHIITLYHRIKANPEGTCVPRTVIFGAKAAPGYFMAKLIIKLINAVAEVVNNDPDIGDRLKVVFLENFNVSLAEKIYPAADLSEQISLAGKEASGTGNMKFALNGAITIGTLDGANIEIRDLVGSENFFLFGLTSSEVQETRSRGYDSMAYYRDNPELRQVIDSIAGGMFSQGDTFVFGPIVDALLHHDEYMLCADYAAYVACQDAVSAAYLDQDRWVRMSILNTARCGFFSSDRAIRQYCEQIWNAHPVEVGL